MPYENIIYEREGRVVRIIMNRPEKRNPLSWAMMSDIIAGLGEAKADTDVRVVIIKGAGPSFSGGHDLSEIGIDVGLGPQMQHRPSVRLLLSREDRLREFYKTVFDFPKPIIAQVHGYCLHGAFNFQLVCDITIAAQDAHFEGKGAPVVNIPNYMPEVAFPFGLGRRNIAFHVSGRDAENLGLITRAVPADKLEKEVEKLASTVALMPADALELNKNSVNGVLDLASLGGAWRISSIAHGFGTLQRMRPGEYSFFKSRRDAGVKATIEARRAGELARQR
ncbi:MAG: enoyl-CoA hydratase/isomerase family protein [Chloroflexota bacterium]